MIFSGAALLAATALLGPVAAQLSCGGNQYTPASVNFTDECYDAITSCTAQFEANASMVNCQDAAGNIFLQQQSDLTTGTGNSLASLGFSDITNLCVLSGWTSATYGYSSNQWYWISAGPACYTNAATDHPTHPAPFCLQNSNDVLPQCYPEPHPNKGGLKVLKYAETVHGATQANRGWNTWGTQALTNASKVVPSYHWDAYNEMTAAWIKKECTVLTDKRFVAAGFDLCSIDSGWQQMSSTDDNGRITYDPSRFNMPELGKWLHARGLKFGLYIIPGVPCEAANKTILGTNNKVSDAFIGNNDGIFCDFNYSNPLTQVWHDSVIDLWTSWGMDFLKLDYLTPGSPQNGADLLCDTTGAARAYDAAIQNSGMDVKMGLSWKLCRNETYLPIWSSLAESMRTDQDLDNYGTETFMEWSVGQRAIENYRQWIGLQAQRDVPITIHPDMDNWFAFNAPKLAGINDTIRYTVANHWIGAGANLVIGNDLLQIDELGWTLATSKQSIAAADFHSKFPMQPRNPGTGQNTAQQLQAWIAGPDPKTDEAYVLIVNYGPDGGSGGFGSQIYGRQPITVTLEDLGLAGKGKSWKFNNIWSGDSVTVKDSYTVHLTEGESSFFHVTKKS